MGVRLFLVTGSTGANVEGPSIEPTFSNSSLGGFSVISISESFLVSLSRDNPTSLTVGEESSSLVVYEVWDLST